MSGGGTGREQNYWPGFVDALSNVVLTLVFVLVVFVFALVITSSKVEKRAAAIVQAAHEKVEQQQSSTYVQDLQAELSEAKTVISELQAKVKGAESVANKSNVPTSTVNMDGDEKQGLKVIGSVIISSSKNIVTIIFPKSVSDLDEASLSELNKQITSTETSKPVKVVLIKSYIGTEAYSAARRLAYYRVISLRNHVLSHAKYKNLDVQTKIVQPESKQDGRVEIIFD